MNATVQQRHRVNRAVNFARSNIAEPLDVSAMADVACLSKFHFSRVFKDHFHETPSQFLLRIRLEKAARHLVYHTHDKVTDVAYDCGFSSPDAFARSFRSRFASTPRIFRKCNDPEFGDLQNRMSDQLGLVRVGDKVSPEEADELRVCIETRPSYRAAYIRHVGPYGDLGNSITATFMALRRWAKVRGVLKPNTSYVGVCPDNNGVTPGQYCTYDACIVLEDEVEEDDIVSVQTVPGGRYAVLSVASPAQQLNQLWSWLYADWLTKHDTRHIANRSYEYFGGYGMSPARPETGVELCLPLAD